jgi:hypothetical protein
MVPEERSPALRWWAPASGHVLGNRGLADMSLRSSTWMRGAPQRGFARLISRTSCRTSRGTLGLPGRRRDCQRQKLRNPARCHRIIVSGRTIVTASRTVGASRYSNMKDKAIQRFEGRALGCAATQKLIFAPKSKLSRMAPGAKSIFRCMPV